MGSSFKSAVFADDVADHLRGWADGARRRMRRSATAGDAAGCGSWKGGAAQTSFAASAHLVLRREAARILCRARACSAPVPHCHFVWASRVTRG
jgi:hypothetical protein